jgi:hypothetical protein
MSCGCFSGCNTSPWDNLVSVPFSGSSFKNVNEWEPTVLWSILSYFHFEFNCLIGRWYWCMSTRYNMMSWFMCTLGNDDIRVVNMSSPQTLSFFKWKAHSRSSLITILRCTMCIIVNCIHAITQKNTRTYSSYLTMDETLLPLLLSSLSSLW